ncbi:hypothetical protein DNL40_10965 [Xylanimonas oleitrophica]|uniref:PPM-type phosphatase domain-containing protein n=1 Tax=Xylanimonas oleitrophica TaxID=2607479 RepID=A0A2W5WMS0_9MICO|nr:PP2C family protein-serine/threonine phosphatase [Xylanimonas oleitrophica]PZR52627.1 hypothetical protein DNL40_10965 [Xylanimonas oleitrophica]
MTPIVPPGPERAPLAIEAIRDVERRALAELDAAVTPAEVHDVAVRHVKEFVDALTHQTIAARQVAASIAEREDDARRRERVLAHLAADSRDESVPLGIALTRSGWTRRLVGADGAIVRAEGRVTTVGEVPGDEGVSAVLEWVGSRDEEVVVAHDMAVTAPGIAASLPGVLAVLGIALPDGQALVWLRHQPPATWSERDVDDAVALRGHLVEALYLRGRKEVRATEALQRSLLPGEMPAVDGWHLQARYDAAGAGLVGGDWYDALLLPTGKVALVVGDVTGHGLQAAATMGQLRNTLRAALMTTQDIAAAAERLCEIAALTLPGEVATVVVALLDPATGQVEHVSLGHPPLLVVGPRGEATWGPRADAPPLGIAAERPPAVRLDVPDGGALVLYSDGLVERRGESIRVGLSRLERAFRAGSAADVDDVVRSTRDPGSADDATLLVLRRG